jgi:hypothetical protein
MNARVLLIAIPVLLGLGMLALVLLTGHQIGLEEEDPRNDDPVLVRLRERNPGLHLARGALERSNRIPVYWVTHPEGGQRLLVPRSLVSGEGGAVIRFAPCDPSNIPERLRYPRASAPACLTIERDDERLHAFYFQTDDSMHRLVKHYDGEVGRIGNYTEQSYRQVQQADGSTGFSHSYWMYERPNPNHQVFALVGYRWERLRADPEDAQ